MKKEWDPLNALFIFFSFSKICEKVVPFKTINFDLSVQKVKIDLLK